MTIVKLLEATDAFNKYLSDYDVNEAKAKYPDRKSRRTQLAIYTDAKAGNLKAINYLYNEFKSLIAKTFWKYYLGPDKKYWPSRLRAGEDYDFASKAYELLASGESEKTSPYNTFDPDKFDANTDIIKKFGYYFGRYLQNEAFKMIRKNKSGGISGNIPKDVEISTSSTEDRPETSVGDNTEDIDLKLTLDAFEQSLKGVDKEIFDLRKQGMSLTDIASKLDIGHVTARKYLANIKDRWESFIQ